MSSLEEDSTQLEGSVPTEDGSHHSLEGVQTQEPWGRLLPLKRGEAHIKLFPRPALDTRKYAFFFIIFRWWYE